MKLSVGKRILMFFHWLLSLLICAVFAIGIIRPELVTGIYDKLTARIGEPYMKIIGIAILAVYVILAIVQICLILRRAKRTDRGFITVDSSETGRVRIAVPAIEQMVRQSVNNIDGITEMKIDIENQDDAIAIVVNASILNGSHVPTITMNMQRAIRQFVEMNCGVAVRTVSISINAVTNQSEPTRRRRRGRGEADVVTPAVPPVVEPANTYAAPVNPVAEETVSSPVEPAPSYSEQEPTSSEPAYFEQPEEVPVFEAATPAYPPEPEVADETIYYGTSESEYPVSDSEDAE